jgi:hypothetical protein
VLKPGAVATTAELGIDAALPDRVPRGRFGRMTAIFRNDARLEEYF